MSYRAPYHKPDQHKLINLLPGQLKQIRLRLLILLSVCMAAFFIIQVRLLDIMGLQSDHTHTPYASNAIAQKHRGKILDAHGNVIATTLTTASLYANPKMILDAHDASQKLCTLFKDLTFQDVFKKLSSDKGFVWIKRNLSPTEQQRIMELGIPALDFEYEKKRIYPQGGLFSHIVGLTDIDGNGIAGIEKKFDESLKNNNKDIQLSLSLPVQHILRDELQKSIQKFNAEGGSAIVVSIKTGKVIGMVSAPDFDPNTPSSLTTKNAFNRNTLGVYELGSIMKLLNTALFLEHGNGDTATVFDASQPLKIGRFLVRDYRGGKGKPLTVEEIFFYSSNIGSALMALSIGPEKQMDFLKTIGLLAPMSIELPEKGRPIMPRTHSKASCMTIAFGHGVASTPIQFMQSITNLLNGSHKPLSILANNQGNAPATKETTPQLFSNKNKKEICRLMQRTLEEGTSKKARVKGYLIGGKTGTAEVVENGRYVKTGKNLTSFVGVFPINNPEYVVFTTLDKPHGLKETFGFTAAGWNAAPLGGNIISRVASVLGIEPDYASK